jgi:hypothetical protein
LPELFIPTSQYTFTGRKVKRIVLLAFAEDLLVSYGGLVESFIVYRIESYIQKNMQFIFRLVI